MTVPLYHVDAFADRPFAGNPAAVCLLDGPREDSWLAAVAREMNLSETAFLQPEGEGWSLRWFTPAVEVDLCGHATLASAHVLWDSDRAPAGSPIRFATRSGELVATRSDEAGEAWISMDFPALPPEALEPSPAGLAEALGAAPIWAGRSRFDVVVELADESTVCALAPDFSRLMGVEARGVIVTARSERPGVDFVSRFFAPRAGVPEDPVTGSAHSVLAPLWCRRLGRDRLVGRQVSARGGTVRVHDRGDRVDLGGRAWTVAEGVLTVPS
jgi:PhzF family phenazine biosynthesis protein